MFLGHVVYIEEFDFLGLVEYYCKFIEGFTLIAVPLTKFLRKDVPFKWTDEQQSSFEKLKALAAIVSTLKIWMHYFYPEKCYIYTDQKSLKYLLTQKELKLRQWRSLELLKYYDCVTEYHPGKENVVAGALNRKQVIKLIAMFARLSLVDDGGLLAELWKMEKLTIMGSMTTVEDIVYQTT
ncbi:integrase [Gossypium australe]|uniref:Integrase n=1 Tax=Gossypium australe TaxID=47621 RepID=A0A5B6V9T5_9ROSI|nr:integrase [Gossypium australe]